MGGALSGLKIIEMAGIGPAPFAATMLADHGAQVIRVERAGPQWRGEPESNVLLRSRKRVTVDLKTPEGVDTVRALVRDADGLVEGFRPGVMERLGLGPEVLLADNPRLVYGRMTGWGQTGPLAQAAGHDINYIALAGNLHGYGRAGEKPTPPINAIGDFAGGGMMLAFGMVAGILSARGTGQGQVIDCAMTDGSAMIHAMTWGMWAQGLWRDERGVNLLDTGAHFYDTYETADGHFIALGSIEPQFYALMREKLGLVEDQAFDAQMNPDAWPELKARLTDIFKSRPRAEWCALLEGTDVCFAPVLSMAEALQHPHNVERATFVEVGGLPQPAPSPRFLGTPAPAPARAVKGEAFWDEVTCP